VIASFLVCLLAFMLIGLASSLKSRPTRHDYYLADGTVKPWLVGLSAVATNNSGYMFIGVIGYTYATGLPAFWLMVGWIAGDFLGSTFVHSRLRAATARSDEVSYAGVLSTWYGNNKGGNLQRVIGGISLVFLLCYASAQLVAGSKALHVLFGWPLWAGAVLGAVMVAVYCYAGGIRASIWTDAAQSLVMILAMGTLLFVAVDALGGPAASWQRLDAIPHFMDWFPRDLPAPGIAGPLLFALGWGVAGLSVVGQPHIMVRFMTLDDNANMRIARAWYYLWFIAFYAMATGVGLLSRIYIPGSENFDAELALPTMAQELLSPWLVGLILAGIFAATMSTADSLVLSCSAAITHDLLPHRVEHRLLIKLATLTVTAVALGLALAGVKSVFNMVILAWSGLGSAFAPLLIWLCLGRRPAPGAAVAAIFAGFATALVWRWLGLQGFVYEGLPGIAAGMLVLFAASRLGGASERVEGSVNLPT